MIWAATPALSRGRERLRQQAAAVIVQPDDIRTCIHCHTRHRLVATPSADVAGLFPLQGGHLNVMALITD